MRIGMISQWYAPEAGSAAHPTAIAEALHARGHDVDVLTSFPSYPIGHVHSGYTMRPRLQEEMNRIRLLRVPDVPSHDDNAVRRAASLTSFAVSACAQVGWLRDVDACLVYLTPATVGAAAMALKTLAGTPYVLYVQDLWPETVTASGFIRHEGVNRVVERALTSYLTRLYRGADSVAALSPTMARTLSERGTRRPAKSIPNWIDEAIFSPAEPLQPRELPEDRTWVMYAGGIGEVQALDHAVRALTHLDDRPDIGLALVGDGTARPSLETLARKVGVDDRVRFLGRRSMNDMPGLMAQAAAQLVSLRDQPLFRGTIPSKVQASMACASPVICAVAGDATEVVDRLGAGITVSPEDPVALAAAFRRVADTPVDELRAWGERGRRGYLSELGAAAGAARLEHLLADAAAHRRRRWPRG